MGDFSLSHPLVEDQLKDLPLLVCKSSNALVELGHLELTKNVRRRVRLLIQWTEVACGSRSARIRLVVDGG